ELAALRRERELLGREREVAQAAAQDWSREREHKEGQLRQLESQRAALAAELREQQEHHQQRLADLQAARDELRAQLVAGGLQVGQALLRAQFAELAGKIFDEREQRFAETSQQRLGQLLDPLKERIQA